MIEQSRDYFENRDIDCLHDWNSDLQDFDLPTNSETFLRTQKKLVEEIEIRQEIILPEMLNPGQRQIYDYMLRQLMYDLKEIEDNDNVIIMRVRDVSKSFLIRALEHGI